MIEERFSKTMQKKETGCDNMEQAKEIRIEIPEGINLSEKEKESIERAMENAIIDVIGRDTQEAKTKAKVKAKVKVKEKA